MEIVSLGWFDHGNCGDEAFKCALRNLFPAHNIHFVNNIPKNKELIGRSDHLLIGGGNIVNAHFLRGLEDVETPHSFIGIGVVDGDDLEMLRGARTIIARDQHSCDIIDHCHGIESYLAPDIAFSMVPDARMGEITLSESVKLNPDRKTVGVFLNDCVSGNFNSTILKFIECERVKLELARFLEGLDYNVVFIPMSTTPPDDRRIALDVVGKMKNGYKYTCGVYSLHPQECLDITSAFDFAITMRLHASIFCTIAGVPFVDLLHHDKSKAYLASIGEGGLGLDYYGLNARNLADKFEEIEQSSEQIRRRLRSKGEENKRQLEELVHNVHIP